MGNPRDAVDWIIEGQVLSVTSSTERDSIIEAIRAACEDPRFRPGLDLLIDARELQRAAQQLPPPLLRGRAFEIRGLGFRRCAVVAAEAPLQVDLANMFATYADQAGVDARVFANIEEAESWLRISGQGRSAILSGAPGPGGSQSSLTAAEIRLARIRELLRTFLQPMPSSSKWSDAQREAHAELQKEAEAEEAGGPMEPRWPAE
jgi:SpoIIAA-like